MFFSRPRLTPLLVATLAAAFALPAFAGELRYAPTNPTFGGNPFNGSTILARAAAQNDHERPTTTTSDSDLFARQLRSILQGQIASRLSESVFGADGALSGQIPNFDGTFTTYTKDPVSGTVTLTGLPGIAGSITVGTTATP